MELPRLALPIYAFERARSAGFSAEFLALRWLSLLVPPSLAGGRGRPAPRPDLATALAVRSEIVSLLGADSERIAGGDYPISVLKPESPLSHLGRIPRLLADSFSIHLRRARGRTADFDDRAREFLPGLPRYYRRCFHFQTGGYLSRRSAEMYEHQVELLFQGCADAMRRLLLAPLRRRFGPGDGEGLRFLEIGAGTGRATRFAHLAFPKARITAIDLSDPYLKVAQRNLRELPRIDFVQADGAHLPFKSGEFDAAYSVFLFHELPADARLGVVAESRRVLRKGGFFAFVDSLQTGDNALFDPLLKRFPKEFYEPFYHDYIGRPMEKLIADAGFGKLARGTGFTAKHLSCGVA